MLIRNQELIPVDGILISPSTSLDYSFVTGEAEPIEKKSGDKLFAGGKQMGRSYRNGSVVFCFTKLFDTALE